MNTYKNIIIGFGKGGKTLAKELAKQGEEVLVIEKSPEMYGGTCINIGCLPSKSLIHYGEKELPLNEALILKDTMVQKLRNKNYHLLADDNLITVMNGEAYFLSDNIIQITQSNNQTIEVIGERIFINTGAKPVSLPIEGLSNSKYRLDSTDAMNLSTVPKDLAIIGAGYIGLEFASMFTTYGSRVHVLDARPEFISREDKDISDLIKHDLMTEGVTFNLGVSITKVADKEDSVEISYTEDGVSKLLSASKLLVAVGRKPNTEYLGLENTSIEIDDRGAIIVNDVLKTSVKNVWAMGDVTGGAQFTYVSLDDYRIITDSLFGEQNRSTKNRGHIPYSVFLTPPLSRVGATEKELIAEKKAYRLFKMPVSSIPKAQVIGQTKGLFKVLVDPDSNLILGASLYGVESHEIINLISLGMDLSLDYRVLRDRLYTHPTIAESLNDLLK